MAKVRKRLVVKKAFQSFVTYSIAVGGALSQIEIPEGELSEKALITLGVAALAAVLRAVNNVRKTRKAPPRAVPGVDYRNITTVLLLAGTLAMAGILQGCEIIHSADGGWTARVDQPALDAAWDRYEAMERRKTDLERERETASGPRLEAIRRELEVIDPQVRELAEVLGVDGQLRAVQKKNQ